MLNNILKDNRGFSITEIMIASFVIIIGVLASYMVVQDIFANTFNASSRLTAAYLAEEGIELVRNIRDSNWVEGNPWDKGLKRGGGFDGCDPEGSQSRYCEIDYDDFALQPFELTVDPRPLKLNGAYNYDAGTDTIFRRKISVIGENPNNLQVKSEVIWQEGVLTKSLTAIAFLYDWKFKN